MTLRLEQEVIRVISIVTLCAGLTALPVQRNQDSYDHNYNKGPSFTPYINASFTLVVCD